MDSMDLIPLRVLLGNPYNVNPLVSPDGSMVAFLRPSANKDVLNVWTRPVGGTAADDVQVTNDALRGIRVFFWAEDGKNILYLQDKDGDEDWHLYVQPVGTHKRKRMPARDLTPFKGVRAENLLLDRHHPNKVYVGLNKRDSKVFDTYSVDLATGQLELDTENPGDVTTWLADYAFVIRACVSMNAADGSQVLRVRDSHGAPWRDLLVWPQDDEGSPVCFAKDGKSIYVTSSLGRDTTELQRVSTAEGAEVFEAVARRPDCDVGSVMIDEDASRPVAVSFKHLKQEWQVLDPTLERDFQHLSEVASAGPTTAEVGILSRSHDNNRWTVSFTRDDAPQSYHVFDRAQNKSVPLFDNRPELHKYSLGKMHPVIIPARDGLELPSYLSLPPMPSAPTSLPSSLEEGTDLKLGLPLVLYVHGGPWARDSWGLEVTAQWFANRGYAVLQVNYRGSTGFGKRFLHAGDKQWGVGTMQHDLTDAVTWAVQHGIADPKRVAIYGGSYGGYAALAGLAFTPELYACGVDVVGPSHVRTLLQSVPPYWEPFKRLLRDRVGDAETDDDWNHRISPFYHAANINAPLIIAQGANDPRVKKAESDQIYRQLKAQQPDLDVQYWLYTDEGHGFARPPNRLHFCHQVDRFLATHLGGRAEPEQQLQGAKVVAMHALESLDVLPVQAAGGNVGRAGLFAAVGGVAAAAVAGAVVATVLVLRRLSVRK